MPNDDSRILAGAMSGTSADGVDVAIVRIRGRGTSMTAELLHHHHRDYDAQLKQAIFAMRGNGAVTLAELGRVGREISLAYATAVNEALDASNLRASQIAAIAAHGQTLYHNVPTTIQWLDPALLAAEVGCPVVSDFRRADCAAGGQGAPLVPFADYILFRHPTRNRVLLNIGGIANLTLLRAGGGLDQVIAFDTGPGNCISDWICRTNGPLEMSYDLNGAGASQGRVITEVVDAFLSDAYFAAQPPKSTDGPQMIVAFERAWQAEGPEEPELNDLLATASSATAASIQLAIKGLGFPVDEVIASGGGVSNKSIMRWLQTKLKSVPLRTLESENFNGVAKEAIAFALLGAATLDNEPSNVPSVTGAKRAVVLGSITPKP